MCFSGRVSIASAHESSGAAALSGVTLRPYADSARARGPPLSRRRILKTRQGGRPPAACDLQDRSAAADSLGYVEREADAAAAAQQPPGGWSPLVTGISRPMGFSVRVYRSVATSC